MIHRVKSKISSSRGKKEQVEKVLSFLIGEFIDPTVDFNNIN